MRRFPSRRALVLGVTGVFILLVTVELTALARGDQNVAGAEGLSVFAYNDLGMHCMNDDFSDLVILPPYNNLRVQVIERRESPEILDGDATVRFFIPSNTRSADKTDFWSNAGAIFGSPPANIGLTGNGLSGVLTNTPHRYWEATGIPLTPIEDTGRLNPYPLARIDVDGPNGLTGSTVTVIPVSAELNCNLCHHADGVSTGTDILRDHDTLHGTNLEAQKPVLCASCHADVALGLPGNPNLPNLSSAIHSAHAPRMDMVDLDNKCYACHPGLRTQCQRDVHLANGIMCTNCHGDMTAVGDPGRAPWVDEPRCGDCHAAMAPPGYEFEQPGTLFKDSVGHKGVLCSSCHGSPHAITPTVTAADNQQAIAKQGAAGVISDCIVCHTQMPEEPFFHRVEHD